MTPYWKEKEHTSQKRKSNFVGPSPHVSLEETEKWGVVMDAIHTHFVLPTQPVFSSAFKRNLKNP